MHASRAIHQEPLPGYRLLEPLGKGGFGEVWKCRAPGGLFKAIKFVHGDELGDPSDSRARQEWRALQHVKSLRHPFLLSLERVEVVDGDLVIVTELADRSLHDLLQEYRQKNQPGIPREQILRYLEEVAEVLDVLNLEHGLQHLDIKPRNLFLFGKHVKVADFGLVASLADVISREELLFGITPLYAAPEIFEGRATLFSDQYSLAITYHELLTGTTPIQGRNICQLAYLVSKSEPDLDRLPERDRPIVARALSKNPRDRYPSSTAFVTALVEGSKGDAVTSTSVELASAMKLTAQELPALGAKAERERKSTLLLRPNSSVAEGNEPLANYQLLENLSTGRGGDLWRARGPGENACLVRFLSRPDPSGPGEEALERLLRLRDGHLAAFHVLTLNSDRIALVCEAGETHLANRLRDARQSGRAGLPRGELLELLRNFAEALDELYQRYQLQHLALTPRQLAFRNNRPLLVEFGLAELLWIPSGIQSETLSLRYAAPELLEGLVTEACDQYSLAIMWQELLTGLHPLRSMSTRAGQGGGARRTLDLSLLSEPDRRIVSKALDADPQNRFSQCLELVQALEEVTPKAERRSVVAAVTSPGLVRGVAGSSDKRTATKEGWQEAIDELVSIASRGQHVLTVGVNHYRLTPGQCLEQRAWARIPQGMGRLKLSGFRDQWQGELLSRTATHTRMEIRASTNFLQRCLGQSPGLYVEVVLGTPRESTDLTPMRITMEPIDCTRARAEQLLSDLAPTLLASLHTYFQPQVFAADQERYLLSQAVQVQTPTQSDPVSGQVRDIGTRGLALRSLSAVPVGPVTLTLNRWASPLTVQVPGLVRDCLSDDGQYEVEIEFVQ